MTVYQQMVFWGASKTLPLLRQIEDKYQLIQKHAEKVNIRPIDHNIRTIDQDHEVAVKLQESLLQESLLFGQDDDPLLDDYEVDLAIRYSEQFERDSQHHLAIRYSEQFERDSQHQVIKEQDREYQESVQRDLEKDAQRLQIEKEFQRKAQLEEEQKQLEEEQKQLEAILASKLSEENEKIVRKLEQIIIPQEPIQDQPYIQVQVHLPCGHKLLHRWRPEGTIAWVRSLIEVQALEKNGSKKIPHHYVLVTDFPRMIWRDEVVLGEMGLGKNVSMRVEAVDEK